MIASGIEIDWGGAQRRFALPIAQLRPLQAETDVGPAILLQQLGDGARVLNAMRATLRRGLEGGGMGFLESEALVSEVIGPALEGLLLARAILSAWAHSTQEALKSTGLGARGKADTPDPTGKIDWGSYLSMAGAAGIQDVESKDFADLIYLIAGWKKFHCAPDKPVPPTVAEHEAAKKRWAEMQARVGV